VRAITIRLSLLILLGAGTATAADPPVQDLADGRTGKIYFESLTPTGFFQLAKRQATQKTVIFRTLQVPKKAAGPVPAIYGNAYHDFDSIRPPVRAKNVVTGRNCNMLVDLDRFAVMVRATGEDITRTAASYERRCLERGVMVGGDSEGRKKSPEDVKTFLKKVFAL
jgi:hypothetical protein